MFCTQCGGCIPNYCSCVHHTHNIIELEDHSKKKYQVAMTVLNQLFLPFVGFCLLLPVNIYGQYYVGTPGLRSSLEGSNRKFACPQESIALTCSISGLVLIWEAQEGNNTSDSVRVGFFSQNDHAGEGFSNLEQFSCHRELIFSGVLEYINSSIYISSMIMTPSSWNVSSNCDPLTIICKSSDPEAEANTMNLTYKVAGRPTAPRNSTCVYHEYSDLISINIVINVTDIMLNNTQETDISYVSIAVSNTRDLEQLYYNYSITSITKIDILNATFSCLNHVKDHHGIRAYIITVDKCGQESLTEIINCKTLGRKGQSRSNTQLKNYITGIVVLVIIIVLAILVIIVLSVIIIKMYWQYFRQRRNSSTNNQLINDTYSSD